MQIKEERNNAEFREVKQVEKDCSLSRNTVVKLAKECDAIIRIGRKVLIDYPKFAAYLREHKA